MAVRRVQLRRGTSAQNNAFTGAEGEITVDTDRKSIRVHDGATAGGTETARVDLSNIDFDPNATVSFADSDGDPTVRLINVANPTNPQDVATKDYVDSAGASEILLSELGDTFIVAPADAQILIYDNDAGANDDKWKNVTLSGDVTITNTGVVTLTTDSVVTSNITNANVTNAKLANPSVTITDGTTSDTLALGQTLTLSNVANETTVVVSADVGAGVSVTIGLPDDVTIANDLTVTRDLGVTRNLTVTGNLVVNGTTTTVNTDNLSVEDPVIELARNASANPTASTDAGFVFTRGSTQDPAVIYWDEGSDQFFLGTANAATGTTTDFSATTTLTKGTLNLATLNASTSVVVNGDTTLQADNSTLAVKTTAGATKFSVDSNNGNTSIAGTLAVTGITTLDDNLSIKSSPTTAALVINSERTGAGEETSATILSVTRGQFGSSSFSWDEGSDKFVFTHNVQGVDGLSVGEILGAPTASISAAGAISTNSTLSVEAASTLNSDVTITNNASLLIETATTTTDPLILLNSDVDGGATPAQNARVVAVKTGAATTSTLDWTNATATWTLSNNTSVGIDLSVGQDLVVTRNLVVNGTAGDGTTLNGNTTVKGDNKTFEVKTAAGVSKFSVDTDDGNTLIAGTLGVTGLSTLASGSTIGDIEITNGQIQTTAVNNNISFNDNNLTTSGNISTTGTGTLTVAGAFTASSTSALNGDVTIATGKTLNIKAAVADAATRLITLNSDVADGTGTPAQNAVLAVGTGAGTYATITWVHATDTWTLSNNLSLASNLSITGTTTLTNDLNLKTTATNGITFRSEIGGAGADGDATLIRVNKGAAGFATLSWVAATDTFSLGGSLVVDTNITATTGDVSVTGGDLIVGATFSVSNAGVISTAAEGHLLADFTINDGEITSGSGVINFGVNDLTTTGDISATDITSTGTAALAITNITGATTITNANFTIEDDLNVDKFTVAAATGNTAIAGTLAVTGVTTLSADLDLSDNQIVDVERIEVATIAAKTNTIAVSLADNQAAALQIAEGATPYQTFVTTNGAEKVVFGKIIEAPASSVIANITITNGHIDSGTDAINFNDNTLTTTGAVNFGAATVDSLNVSDNNIIHVGDISLDTISADGTTIQVTMTDNITGAFEIKEAGNSYIKVDTTNGSELVTISKPLSVTNTSTFTAATALNSGVVINENGGDFDLRVEGDTQTHLLFVDASTDRVGINNAAPTVQLDVVGNTLITGVTTLNGGVVINETGADYDFRVEGDTEANLLFVDASEDKIGIGNNTPSKTLDITGTLGVSDKTTLAGSLDLTTDSTDGVTFRSEAGADGNATLLRVKTGAASFATLSWDTNDKFTITDGLNSEADFSVGVRDGAKVFTIASATGNTELSGVLSVKSADLAGDANDQTAVVLLNSDATANGTERDARLEVERGELTNAYLLWDESADSWLVSNKLNSVGDFSVGANKFSVVADTGNTSVVGTLGVTGAITATAVGHTLADFTINNGSITTATAGGISLGNNNLTTTGTITTNNLVVNGTTTTIDSETLEVTDSVIRLNKGAKLAPNNIKDIGIFMERGSDEDDAIFFFDENDTTFKMGLTQTASDATNFTDPTTWGALKIGSLTTTSTITIGGVSNLNGGIAVDTNKFTVDGDTYKLATTGEVQVTKNSATAFLVEKADGSDIFNIDTNTPKVTITTAVLEPDAGIDVGASVFSVSNTGVTSILNTLNVTTGSANAFVVEKANGDDVLVVDTTNVLTILSGDLNIKSTHTNGILFNSDKVGAASVDARLITIERGTTGTDAQITWNETQDEVTLNAQAGLHLVGKAGGLAFSVGDTTSAGTTTTTITTAGVLTTGTVTLDKVTDKSGDGLIVEMADNQAVGLVIRQGTGAGLDYITLATTDASELITLHRATSLSSTLAVTGITTLSESLKLKKVASDTGVIFNSDRAVGDVPNGADFDAILLHVENGGAVGAVDGYLKWDDSDSSFVIEGGKLHLNTDLSVGTTIGNQNFVVTTAGVVTASSDIKTTSGVLKVDTPSQGAITFNSDSTPVEEGDDFGITVIRPAAGNAIFYWDEGDDVWQFNNAGNVRIQNSLIVDNDAAGAITISEGSITSGSGAISFGDENLTTTGKTTTATFEATSTSEFKGAVTLSNVGLTINNAAPSAVFAVTNAGVATIAGLLNANGGIAVDTNKFTVADGSGNTSIAGTLTLTSTAGTTDFSIVNNGNEVFGVDATNGNTSLDGTLGVGDLATLGSLSVTGTSTLNDDVTIATTKTLTLNQGVVNAAADVDAYVYVDRGTNTDTFIRWDEGVDRWMLSNNGTNAYNILHSNDTLLTLTTNSGAGNSYGFSQGVNNTISILGTTAVDNRGIEILNTNGAVTIGFTSTVRVPSDLTVSSALTTSSLEVTGDALISAASIRLKDKLLFMGYQNTSETNDIGFYSLYKYNDGVDVVNRYAGLVYQPVNGPTTGVWKLFDQDSGSSGGTGETDLTISDSELAAIDLKSVTAITDLKVKSSSDNSSAKTALLLNSDQTGTPAATEDVSIEVERGDSTNAKLTWDEGEDRWMADNGTGTHYSITTTLASEGARYACSEPAFAANSATLSAPTAVQNKHAYFLDNGATAGTLNLFALSGSTYDGYVLQLINKGTNTITVDANGAQTIGGTDLTKDIPAGGTLSLIAYSTTWYVL